MKHLQNWLFQKIHGNNLVYNTCWEDPRCDRELLQLDKESEVIMITSAGCNALAYLLDEPKKINCIDVNSRQNALLELKKVFYKKSNHSNLFSFFGNGQLKNAGQFYANNLKTEMPVYAQKYWDKNIDFFNGKGLRKSFYFRGTSGLLAWSLKNYMKFKKNLYKNVEQFFKATSLEQQSKIYQHIESQLWNKPTSWLMNRHLVMSLAGVPKSQQQLFVTKYKNGAVGFMQECMRNVFTKIPVQENYFWQLYFNGSYTENCCPAYLKKENYEPIKNQIEKVSTHTTNISDFLYKNPGQYSHYILLDHQDWLADNDQAALKEEWILILKNSKKGTRILLRSAAAEVDFFPDFVLERIDFQKELTDEIHKKDRVGTYASTYLGIVK